MKGYRYLKNATTLQLRAAACTGCGRCVEVCPHQVFAMADRKARIEERDACMECGACQRNCPAGAISVDAGVGCATGIINEWLRERKVGKGGCCGADDAVTDALFATALLAAGQRHGGGGDSERTEPE